MSEIIRIRDALKKTGFPLELEVSAVLTERDYDVWGNQFFEHDGKVKEIDMEAWMPCPSSRSAKKWSLHPNVVIECKMSQRYAWVFHRSATSIGHCAIAHSVDAVALSNKSFDHLCNVLDLHYSDPDCDIASTYSVIDPKSGGPCRNKQKDEIFDAVSHIREFINYTAKRLIQYYDLERRDIIYFFPLIVLDGMLYEADWHTRELTVKPVDSIVVETRTVSSVTGQLEPMYIDVVAKRQLTAHLSLVEEEVRAAARKLSGKRTQNFLNRTLANRKA